MTSLLTRLAEAWRSLPQSTKLLLAGLLLVSAVTLWYGGLYLPAQVPAVAEPTPVPAPQATPQAKEAPPI
ncbi:MAG: competence protein, partial [Thermus sp.]|nr:competence protein [Thermus sp.]